MRETWINVGKPSKLILPEDDIYSHFHYPYYISKASKTNETQWCCDTFFCQGFSRGWLLNGVVAWWAATILPASLNPLEGRPRILHLGLTRPPLRGVLWSKRGLSWKSQTQWRKVKQTHSRIKSANRCQCEMGEEPIVIICYWTFATREREGLFFFFFFLSDPP